MKTHKIVVLGDFGVGKTSLIRRYVLDEFSDVYRATLGVHLYKHSGRVAVEGVETESRLVLWDIEGTSEPGEETARYIAGASGAIIVGDITRSDPAEAMREAAFLFESCRPGCPVAFALNKVDLVDDDGPEYCAALADEFDATITRTSARADTNVTEIFNALTSLILARNL